MISTRQMVKWWDMCVVYNDGGGKELDFWFPS